MEDRTLLAAGGPNLVTIAPNTGGFLVDGDVEHVAPRELTFQFAPGNRLDPSTLNAIKIERSGFDGNFTDGNEVPIAPGFLDLGNSSNVVVMRFAETLPDDVYRITIDGTSANALTDIDGDAFAGGTDFQRTFTLDLGAQVISVIPQPVSRNVGGQLVQAKDQVVVYFNQEMDAARAEDPQFYQLQNKDDGTILIPASITYESDPTARIFKATLTFGQNLPQGTWQLSIGQSTEAAGAIDVAIDGGALFDSTDYTTDGVIGDRSNGAADIDRYIITLTATGDVTITANAAPGHPTFDVGLALRDAGSNLITPDSVIDTGPGGTQQLIFNGLAAGDYLVDVGSQNAVGGSYTLNVAVNGNPISNGDDNSSFATATDLGYLGAAGQNISSQIEQQNFVPRAALPGSIGEIGHRSIPQEGHGTGGLPSTGEVNTSGDTGGTIAVRYYNFKDVYGTRADGAPYLNAITEAQKQRAREIFEIYSYYTGIEFIETASSGLTVVTGSPSALDPTIPPTAVGGIASGGTAIINSALDWGQSEYGGGWMMVAFHEIGHSLGLGHSYDIPSVQGGGLTGEKVFTGDEDFVHLLNMYNPDANDIDLHKFTLSQNGYFTAEITAERLATTSLLDSVLTLYREVTGPDGIRREIVARNDNYFSNDSFIGMHLEAGTYFIAVTSTGNTDFNPVVSNSGNGGTTDGRYDLRLDFVADPVNALVDTDGTPLDGDSDGHAGGEHKFWFRTGNTIFVDRANDTTSGIDGDGSLVNPYDTISAAIAAASGGGTDIIRIVGNGGTDGNLDTEGDANPYLIGLNSQAKTLRDGSTFEIPKDVTVMVDAGAVIKFKSAIVNVGSSIGTTDRSHGSLQILGTPENHVFLTSYHNDSIGGNSDGVSNALSNGNWGGLVFRNNSDSAIDGTFLNYVDFAEITYGGGLVFVDSVQQVFNPIHIVGARPTITNNIIRFSADHAMSADPNAFEETRDRVGPKIHGNLVVNNSFNSLFVRIESKSGQPVDRLTVSARFDDTDIVHVITENLHIDGTPGGPFGTTGRTNGRLAIDPGMVVKMEGARIEMEVGGSQLIAEGTVENPVIITGLRDDSYGAGGTFDTTGDGVASRGEAGQWGGLIWNATSSGSLDHVVLAYGGGETPIEGGFARFNPIEIRQADVRIANSTLRDNDDGYDSSNRNGRGSNARATIFVRGAQPVIVDNTIRDNAGDAISINANSLIGFTKTDTGRQTGAVDLFTEYADNYGPLVRGNRLANNRTNGMEVRGEELTGARVWDDTDIVHVVRDEISSINFHTYGGLRLQSSTEQSLVVKLEGDNAGFTATGEPLDIDDRVGGTVQIIGGPNTPVILTSLTDDSVGAGLDPDGNPMNDTNNDGVTGDISGSLPSPGTPLTVTQSTNANTLLNALLLNSLPTGVTLQNATYAGGAQAAGTYNGGDAVPLQIPLKGTVLTTGSANIPTSNTVSSFGSTMGVPGDASLNSLGAGTTTEATSLTFQVVVDPNSGIHSGSFKFQFASEEFPEFVNFGVNDVAGAFVNGSNVMRDSLGKVINVDNALFSIDNTGSTLNVEYDGMTIGLVATFALRDGVNTIKIAIGDVGDTIYDSAIFVSDLQFSTETVTGGGGVSAVPSAGDWRGIVLDQWSNDRNVDTVLERESLADSQDVNSNPFDAQFLGTLAANENAGTNDQPLGFDIHGYINNDNPADLDVYSFSAIAGTEVWIDIDATDFGLDSVVELINPIGQVIARSIDVDTLEFSALNMRKDAHNGPDTFSPNIKDAGMRVILPGNPGDTGTYFVRVRSNTAVGDIDNTDGGLTSGRYRLQIRLRQIDEIPGSTIQYSNISYAKTGIEISGLPAHSPLLGESYETSASNNNSDGSLLNPQNLGNLLASDRNVISVGGTISSQTDVDWYKLEMGIQQIQSIAGVNAGAKTWATVFDIDYADGLVRPDTVLSVFDSNGNLVFVSRDSSIEDDQPAAGQGTDFDDLTRGSAGPFDPFLGNVQLPAAGPGSVLTYYVAVSSNYRLPLQLDQSWKGNAANQLVRLEPVNSVTRVVEDHIGYTGYSSGGQNSGLVQVDPTTDAILHVEDGISLSTNVVPWDLGDVSLYISQSRRLYIADPLNGGDLIDVGNLGSSTVTTQDIAMRSDGRLFGYSSISGSTTTAGNVYEINVGNAVETLAGDDDISDVPTGGSTNPDLLTTDNVDAFAFRRTGVADYNDVFLAVDAGATSKLFRAHPDTFDANDGGGVGQTFYGAKGLITDGNLINSDTTGMAFLGSTLFGVSAGGQFYTINQNTGAASVIKDFSNAANSPEINAILRPGETLQGMAVGPQNVDGGAYSNLLFIITSRGRMFAVNAQGEPQGIFSLGGVVENDANNTTGSAQNLETFEWTLDPAATTGQVSNINDADGTDTSTTIPHISIAGKGDGSKDVYSFTATNGAHGIFDIDFGQTRKPFDGFLTLYASDGTTVLATNETGTVEPGSASANDPFLEYDFTADGTYYIEVSSFRGASGVPSGADYQLHVSVEGHTVDTGTTVTGNGIYVDTGVGSATGLAFSPVDYNLWHPTWRRSHDAGHGVNNAPDNSRLGYGDANRTVASPRGGHSATERVGGASFYFGLETWTNNPYAAGTYFSYDDFDAQYGILDRDFQWDLTSNPEIGNNYNVPGRSQGALITDSFSLSGYAKADLPTLYFNYFLDTQGANSSTNGMRDSARVYISQDGGASWTLVATNNSVSSAELPDYWTPNSAANPADQGQLVQELFDSTGTWRQARIDLANFAGQADLRLRFDFNTAGKSTEGLPGDGFGNRNHNSAVQNNSFEGFYIDDIIVGFTERGEMVTGAQNNQTSFFNLPQNPNFGAPQQSLTGAYQLEIRRGTEFGVTPVSILPDIFVVRTFDTNARFIPEVVPPSDGPFEDFEDTSLTFTFVSTPASPWGPTILNAIAGTTSIKSGAIGNNESSAVSFDAIPNEGDMTFDYHVNSQQDSDYLIFRVNGVEQFRASGNVSGTFTYHIHIPEDGSAGTDPFTFEWDYVKDESGSSGGDYAVIDNIQLPSSIPGVGGLGDRNVHREQGRVKIENNLITNVTNYGIVVNAAPRGSEGNLPHPGAPRNLPVLNTKRLAPGVFIANNVIAEFENGLGGILFSGDNVGGTAPLAAVPFGVIINNTIVAGGGDVRNGYGIRVENNASPTILNNIIAYTDTAISLDSTSTTTVVGANLYKSNNSLGIPGSSTSIILSDSDPLFVDAANGNYYLASGSKAIDSSLNKLDERPDINVVYSAIGISGASIQAPTYDLYGQLRVDDPSQDPPPGLGVNVFKDRGAIERADFQQPFARIVDPRDNDSNGNDLDPTVNVVHVDKPGNVTKLVIELLDNGIGIDDGFVRSNQFALYQDGAKLINGVDYLFNYNPNTRQVTFSAVRGVFDLEAFYTIVVDNAAGSGVRDLAGNLLSSNESDGSTQFQIILTDGNDPPLNNGVPTGTQNAASDLPFVFSDQFANRIYVTDPDAALGTNEVEMTLTTTHGLISIDDPSLVTFTAGTGTGDATMTFRGTIDQLNLAITTITLTPPNGYTGPASLTIHTSDLGNYGDGTVLTDTDVVNFDFFQFPEMSISDVTVNEGGDAVFTVTLSSLIALPVSFHYTTMDGTATSSVVAPSTVSDFNAASGNVTMPANTLTTTITIGTNVDNVDEENTEKFYVKLSLANNATIVDDTGEGTITDVDDFPVLSVSNAATVVEGDTGTKNMVFNVTLSKASARTVTVNYDADDNTATDQSTVSPPNGPDYAPTTGSLTFAPGETSKTIVVPINGDTLDEDDETLKMVLSGSINATIDPAVATGTIQDDDPPVLASILNSSLAQEGNSGNTSMLFTVQLSKASGRTVTVGYTTENGTAVGGTDYTTTTGTVTFNPGETSKTIAIPVKGDTLSEANETFFVKITAAGTTNVVFDANAKATGTIFDDDPLPFISIDDSPNLVEGNTGTTNGTFTVRLSEISGQAVSVRYTTVVDTAGAHPATSGVDFQSTTGVLTFNPGEQSKTFTVPVIGDTRDEYDETFFVDLSLPVKGQLKSVDGSSTDLRGVGTIKNDDVGPKITVQSASANEGSNLQFTVTLSQASDKPITVNYATSNGTALAGASLDYLAATGQLTFAPNVTTQTINVAANNDDLDEDPETLTLTLSNPSNASILTETATGTIIDTDALPLLTINDIQLSPAISANAVHAQFTVSLNQVSGRTVTVQYRTADGTAEDENGDGDYRSTSGLVTFAAGVKTQTIDVVLDTYTLDSLNEYFYVVLETPVNATFGAGVVNTKGKATFAGNQVDVYGSNGNDRFVFQAGRPGVSSHLVSINGGPSQSIDSTLFRTVSLHGLNGVDRVDLTGSAADDIATLETTSGRMSSLVYDILTDSMEKQVFRSGGGFDQLTMTDSTDNDYFEATDSTAYMIGPGYGNTAKGFGKVTANSTMGGFDTALQNDLAGNAQYVGQGTNTSMRGLNYLNVTNGFDRVDAVTQAGAVNTAVLKAVGNNVIFIAIGATASMSGSNYLNTVTNFSRVDATAAAGATNNRAVFNAVGNDARFVSNGYQAYMQNAGAGTKYLNVAFGFNRVDAYAMSGATNNRALFNSVGSDDSFVGNGSQAYMQNAGAGTQYLNVGFGFNRVDAYAKPGTNNKAVLNAVGNDDKFVGNGSQAYMQNAGAGTKFLNVAFGFNRVDAYAKPGATNNKVEFYGVGPNDQFVGNGSQAYMQNAGAGKKYLNVAFGFNRVDAFAKPGGFNTAMFYGSAGNDTFQVQGTRAWEMGAGFLNVANGFVDMKAYSKGGNDKAYFAPIQSTDTVYGRGDSFQLTKASNGTRFEVKDYSSVRATAASGQTATADVKNIDYVFEKVGTWIDAP